LEKFVPNLHPFAPCLNQRRKGSGVTYQDVGFSQVVPYQFSAVSVVVSVGRTKSWFEVNDVGFSSWSSVKDETTEL
jgi:hypothetical protein